MLRKGPSHILIAGFFKHSNIQNKMIMCLNGSGTNTNTACVLFLLH